MGGPNAVRVTLCRPQPGRRRLWATAQGISRLNRSVAPTVWNPHLRNDSKEGELLTSSDSALDPLVCPEPGTALWQPHPR